jgi:hypothetical protein
VTLDSLADPVTMARLAAATVTALAAQALIP